MQWTAQNRMQRTATSTSLKRTCQPMRSRVQLMSSSQRILFRSSSSNNPFHPSWIHSAVSKKSSATECLQIENRNRNGHSPLHVYIQHTQTSTLFASNNNNKRSRTKVATKCRTISMTPQVAPTQKLSTQKLSTQKLSTQKLSTQKLSTQKIACPGTSLGKPPTHITSLNLSSLSDYIYSFRGKRSFSSLQDVKHPSSDTTSISSRENTTLEEWCFRVLSAAGLQGQDKISLSLETPQLWHSGKLTLARDSHHTNQSVPLAPELPSRPEQPVLVEKVPGPRQLGVDLTVYLLHGIAHIEMNAVDMVWDMLLRFHEEQLPKEFYSDFIKVGYDEADHFQALNNRLRDLGSFYGALPSHSRLWHHAQISQNSLLERLALMQLVQETRALDSHQRLLDKVASKGDVVSRKLLNRICQEEVDHVKKGVTWFTWLCEAKGKEPISTFKEIIKKHNILIIPPFNKDARSQAGMTEEWYKDLPTTK